MEFQSASPKLPLLPYSLLRDDGSRCSLVFPILWKRFCYITDIMQTPECLYRFEKPLKRHLGAVIPPPTLQTYCGCFNLKENNLNGTLHEWKMRLSEAIMLLSKNTMPTVGSLPVNIGQESP